MPISTPSSAAKIAAIRITRQGVRWMPSVPCGTVPPKIQLRGLCSPPPNCCEASQPAT